MNKLGFWGLTIAIAFVAGSIVTGAVVFADDALTKLQKKCAKEPKNLQKIKPDCELLALFFGLQTQVDDLEERIAALENPPAPPPPPPPPPLLAVFVDDQDATTFGGSKIVKVVVNDPDLKDTDEVETEPDVTVNEQKLRMVQETSGNWFGYFADRDGALIADSEVVIPGTGLDFGVFCSKDSGFVLGPTVDVTETQGFAIQDPDLVTNEVNGNPDATPLTNLCTDPVPNATPNDLMNVLDAGTMTPAGSLTLQGQIGIRDGFWPFIQLYPFNVNDEVMIKYAIGGGPPEIVTLEFVSPPLPSEPIPILVSVGLDGNAGNQGSFQGAVSRDGRYVAFTSRATNIVIDDNNFQEDVFVRDMQLGETKLISKSSEGIHGNRDSRDPAISGDGRFIAFTSSATNLIAGGNLAGLFLHDQMTEETIRIAQSFGMPAISPDGKFVGYKVNNDEIVLYEIQTGNTINTGIMHEANNIAMSDESRFIAFVSSDQNLVPDETSSFGDLFLIDRTTDEITYLSVPIGGIQSHRIVDSPYITNDGKFVSFMSTAPNLVENDENFDDDSLFVRDVILEKTVLVSIDDFGNGFDANPPRAPISDNGKFVSFSGSVFIHDVEMNISFRIPFSADVDGLSADGRFIVIDGGGNAFVPEDMNGTADVYLITNPFLP